MKNYFQKILSLFARHNYSEQTNQMFYRWLVDNEYEKEKDEALQELYLEARKKRKSIRPGEITGTLEVR